MAISPLACTVNICTAPSRMDIHPAVGSNGSWMLRSVSPRPHCHEEFVPGGRPSGAGQAETVAAGSHAHARSRDKCWEFGTNRIPAGTGNWQLEALSQAHAHAVTKIEMDKCRGVPDPDTSSERQLTSWKKFLKKVLAYFMGYDKNLMWQDMYIGNLIASNLSHNN